MTPDELLLRAKNAITVHDLALAERFALQLVETEDDNPAVHNLLGNIYAKQDEANKAIRSYQRAIELDPHNAEAHNNIGVVYKREGNTPAAIKAFETAYSLAPDRPDIAYNMGNIYKQSGDPERAEDLYRAAIEIDPRFTLAYNNLGSMYENTGRHDEAMAIYRQGLESDSNNPTVRYNLGVAMEATGDAQTAFSEYRHALRSRPGWVDALNNLGVALEKLDRGQEAVQVFSEILRQDPENSKVQNNLGHTLVRLGRVDEAERCYRAALQREPHYVRAALNLEQLQEETGRFDDALESLERLPEKAREDPEVALRQSRVLTSLGRLNEASRSLKLVLVANPKNPRAHVARGNLLRKAGRPNQALASYRKATEYDHSNVEARLNSASLLRERGELAAAAEEVVGALNAKPGAYEPRVLLAQLYSEQKRFDDAEKLLTTLHTETPEDDSVLRTLIEVRKSSGDREGAVRAANELVGLHERAGSPDDIDRLSSSLAVYEETIGDLARENEALWERNIRAFESSVWEEMSGSDETAQIESESLLFGEMPNIADEEVPIIDIGGIEPIIAVNEAEESISLKELEEELEPPPEMEPEVLEIGEPLPPGAPWLASPFDGGPDSGRTGDVGVGPDAAHEQAAHPEEAPGAGDSAAFAGRTRSEDRGEGRGEVTEPEIIQPQPSPRRPVAPPTHAGTQPPTGMQLRADTQLPAGTQAPLQLGGTLRIELVTQQPTPPDKAGTDKRRSESATPRQAGASMPMPTPAPETPAPPEAPTPTETEAPSERTAEIPSERPERLLSYLEGLTRYLPDEQRSIYDGSDMHMRLTVVRSRLRGVPGLHRELLRPQRSGPEPPDEKITPSKIRDTFSFIGELSESHPDEDVGLALKYKIAHILGKLRKSP